MLPRTVAAAVAAAVANASFGLARRASGVGGRPGVGGKAAGPSDGDAEETSPEVSAAAPTPFASRETFTGANANDPRTTRVDGVIVDGVVVDGVAVDGIIVDGIIVDGIIIDGTLVDGTLGGTLDRSRGARFGQRGGDLGGRGRRGSGRTRVRASSHDVFAFRIVAEAAAATRRRGGLVAVGGVRGVFGTVEHSEDALEVRARLGVGVFGAEAGQRLRFGGSSERAEREGLARGADDGRLGGRGVGFGEAGGAARGHFHAAGRREALHLVRRDDTRAKAALGGVERLADVDGEIFGRLGKGGRGRRARLARRRRRAGEGSRVLRIRRSAIRRRRRGRRVRVVVVVPHGVVRLRRGAVRQEVRPVVHADGRVGNHLGARQLTLEALALRAEFLPAADIARAVLLARAPRRTRARVELCPVARAEENKHEAVQLI